MAKKIEEVIEEMINEQMKDGNSIIIHLDEPTLERAREETSRYALQIKTFGKIIQRFCLEKGYGLDYDDVGNNNHFVIEPNGSE